MRKDQERLHRRTWRLIRASWRSHLQAPQVVALVIGVSLAMFVLDQAVGRQDPGVADLARSFAPPPLGTYSVMNVADSKLSLAIPMLIVRSTLVSIVIAMLLKFRWEPKRALRTLAIETGGALTQLGFAFLGIIYFIQKWEAFQGAAQAWGFWILLSYPVLLVLLTVVLSTLESRAAAGVRLRPVLSDGAVWVFSILSTWFWIFGFQRTAAASEPATEADYALAFAMIVLQSVLLGAIALRTKEIDHTRETVQLIREGI